MARQRGAKETSDVPVMPEAPRGADRAVEGESAPPDDVRTGPELMPSAHLLTVPAPLITGAAACFPVAPDLDPAALAEDLRGLLARFTAAAAEDPFSNPVLRLAVNLSQRLASGALSYGALEQLVQYLTADSFLGRAERLGRYLGESDPAANMESLRAHIRALALPEGTEIPIPFEAFRRHVEQEAFGIVITAHPTFNLTGELMEVLILLATGRNAEGATLSESERAALVARMARAVHRPDADLSLSREHELSLVVLANIRAALRRLYTLLYEVAEELYPERWSELTPKLITVASWVGYDLDGRSDIQWTETLRKRLIVQAAQLRHYRAELRRLRQGATGEEMHLTLDLLDSRLALTIKELDDESEIFAGDPADLGTVQHIQRIARRMHEGLEIRLTDSGEAITLIDRALRQATASGTGTATLRGLCVLRTEFANYGLGMAHTHVRINATQLHNAIRKAVGMETAPDDPRYRQSYLAAINARLDDVAPVMVNFGSILGERTSAKRLFMVVAQMLKYSDATTPIRFLIAECESAFTVLTALYYAKLFDVADHLDISPLFETEKALELGSRVIDQLLENPHFRAYVVRRGRLCIQTGYSDAGRYLGQTPAAASIERLKLRILRLFPKHGLEDVQLVIFDTHGESIGRGGHPAGFAERLSYICTPHQRHLLREHGIAFKQEDSFQGGDGFVPFLTPPGALAVITRIIEMVFGRVVDAEDPFYAERDYITEFFTTVKEFQDGLVRDPNYAVLITAFGPNLLYPTGSRALKRQEEGQAAPEHQSVTQIRAIPHNTILQQLGLPANTVSGVGEAIDKDPERFRDLYARSPRFRQLIGMVEYGAAIACPAALKGYVDSLDPGLWLLRAAQALARPEADEMRRLAAFLDDLPLQPRHIQVWRRLFGDLSLLAEDLAGLDGQGGGSDLGRLVSPHTRLVLHLLHALRLSVIHEIFRLATHIPQFSSQHATTPERLIQRILRLEVAAAVEQLRAIFPADPEGRIEGDFGEPASYVSDESQNYRQENLRIFDPMIGLYEILRRIGSGLTHCAGFLG